MHPKLLFRRFASRKGLAAALAMALVLALLAGQSASLRGQAAASAGYTLERGQLSAGGGLASGGDYQVSGAFSAPDAGSMAGGNYQLQGGFWQGTTYRVNLPLVIR